MAYYRRRYYRRRSAAERTTLKLRRRTWRRFRKFHSDAPKRYTYKSWRKWYIEREKKRLGNKFNSSWYN